MNNQNQINTIYVRQMPPNAVDEIVSLAIQTCHIKWIKVHFSLVLYRAYYLYIRPYKNNDKILMDNLSDNILLAL